jgi:gliding motility-associated-like protein
VTLTLSSTSKDDCSISTSAMTVTFGKAPAADAGPDQAVCSQDQNVKLSGKLLIPGGGVWSTLGTGSFSPNENVLNAVYIASAEDIAKGSVKLVLLATSADACYSPADTIVINFTPPPTVNAGGTRYVLAGHTITLMPTVSDENVTYKWSPNIDISNVNIKDPVVTGDVDITYTLTVTDALGCSSSDQTFIKVSPELKAPNVFTPNNDGINDKWNIEGLMAYENATVDIFDRSGQKVFHSLGYSTPWDGTIGGKMLPAGTYYFIIDTKVNNLLLKGPVTIIR